MTGGMGKDRSRDERFLKDVLARTSGPACNRALDMLSGLAEGSLADLDRQLVQGHLEHCDPCRSVAVVFGWLDATLVTMAEVDPGEAFTAAVLERTRSGHQVARDVGSLTGPAGLMDRLGRWWDQQIRRPVFAMQVAYVATVMLVLLTAIPGAPLEKLPGQALGLVQAGPGQPPLVGQAIGGMTGWVETAADSLNSKGRGFVRARWKSAEDNWNERVERTAEDRSLLRTHGKDMIDQAGQGRLGQASYRLWETGKALGGVWSHWWTEERQTASP